jgi:hypothetical protein
VSNGQWLFACASVANCPAPDGVPADGVRFAGATGLGAGLATVGVAGGGAAGAAVVGGGAGGAATVGDGAVPPRHAAT